MFPGTVSVGGVVSTTGTGKVASTMWPALSVAWQTTLVTVPRLKREPEGGAHSTGTAPSVTSVAVTVKVTAAPIESVASAMTCDGASITGASSVTVTVNVPNASALGSASVAVQVTSVVPAGNVDPEGWSQRDHHRERVARGHRQRRADRVRDDRAGRRGRRHGDVRRHMDDARDVASPGMDRVRETALAPGTTGGVGDLGHGDRAPARANGTPKKLQAPGLLARVV